MTNVLVVCTANVCRSPMAGALLGRAVRRRGTAATWVRAGPEAHPGVRRPAGRSAHVREGLDLSGHRSRSADDVVVDAADLVLTMEAHVAALVAGHPTGSSGCSRWGSSSSSPTSAVAVLSTRRVARIDRLARSAAAVSPART